MVWRYERQCTDEALTLKKYICTCINKRASLIFFSYLHILNCYLFQYFVWYFRYFVGTNDMLVGLPTNVQIPDVPKNSEKVLWGGGGATPPCPPPPNLATLMVQCIVKL